MTLEPNMFKQQALAGQAQIISDPANTFVSQVCNTLGAIVPMTATPATQVATALVCLDLAIPTGAATQTWVVTSADALELVDVIVRKSNAGAGNTVQVKNGANAVSDAIAAAVDKTITRAGTIDPAFNTIAAGGAFTVVDTFAAGDVKANVTLVCRRI